ncbi:sodium-coupled monocarboxylate transporter 2 [Marmota marmota marmota]|uniref:sodium-coupled monocarboxylate transporter 2 n=1 Tax=Marmota marmota marmota TaxID=9994 RepID=UPI002091F7F4|nr:sodium-coupled monocarboxylate transporter 2 [Marmota marmota marmota]
MEAKSFSVWDYVVFSALFVISCGIGIFFAIKERKKATSREFLVGGRQMSFGPVALSLTASFMSAVTVLGTPSEVYRFGASFILFFISYTFVIIFTSELFLPVFYRSGITSTYEYLQLRFNKVVRYAATVIYIVQTILYTGVVVYAPALALNQVTGFDLWGSVFATGIVCTFYCTLGGLKAVVWTDAFQMIVMIVGFLTVLIQGSAHNGGLQNVLEQASNGSRLHIVDFDVDPLRRHTLWTISVGGTFTWLGIYGVNQSTIQRCISCKTEKHAKLALYFNLLGLWIILVCAVFSGLIMYSHFKDCDPWTSGMISAPDQVWRSEISQYSLFLCLLFGILCTSMAVAASLLGGVVQAALSIHGMCGGPMLGLFSLGLVFPFVNWKGALGGLITGITLSFWVAIGAFIYPAPDSKTWPLPLSTEQCFQSNVTTAAPPELSNRPTIADTWYSLSYLYYSAVGCLGCIIAGVIISFITGHQRGKDVDPLLIRPVCNLFCFWSKKYKTLCWCGVQHDRGTEQDNLENGGAWKQGDESVLQNGLQQEGLTHVPGYDPKDKSHDNMALEKMTYF